MNFLLAKTGGRKFQCFNCDGEDPLRSPDIAKLLTGELRPLDGSTSTETSSDGFGAT